VKRFTIDSAKSNVFVAIIFSFILIQNSKFII
jgi:hypothetical protein